MHEQLSIDGGQSKADVLKLDSIGNITSGTDIPSTTFITQNLMEDESLKDSKSFELPSIALTAENIA